MGNQLRNQSDSSFSSQQPIALQLVAGTWELAPAQPLFHTGISFETWHWNTETFVLISTQIKT